MEAYKVFVGAIVGYVLNRGPHAGEVRPAIVVKVWSEETVNLQVFPDGSNDAIADVTWETSVMRGSENPRVFGAWIPLHEVID